MMLRCTATHPSGQSPVLLQLVGVTAGALISLIVLSLMKMSLTGAIN